MVGIIRPKADVNATSITGTIAYTSALADEALSRTASNALLLLQKQNPDVDVLTGLPFYTGEEITIDFKKTTVLNYLATLSEENARVFLMKVLAPIPTEEQIAAKMAMLNMLPDEALRPIMEQALQSITMEGITVDMILATPELKAYALAGIAEYMAQEELIAMQFGTMTNAELVALLTDEQYATLYEDDAVPQGYSKSNYMKNLNLLGDVDKDSPATIYLFASSFEDKDQIGALIEEYNNSVGEEQKINYTDYVKLLMSSITDVLNAITYVLIAFVAISLVVSSIMIGIITYISVLERTKEIGILRAIGASKKDIRRVFNAETLIVGFVAGMIGIGTTVLLNQVINIILFKLTGLPNLKAVLPTTGAIVLVVISTSLTLIAGLFPSGVAAKKNPVEALRTE